MVGFGPMPATIPVGTAAPPGAGGSHRLAAPLSAAGMETAACWLQAAAAWTASEAQESHLLLFSEHNYKTRVGEPCNEPDQSLPTSRMRTARVLLFRLLAVSHLSSLHPFLSHFPFHLLVNPQYLPNVPSLPDLEVHHTTSMNQDRLFFF